MSDFIFQLEGALPPKSPLYVMRDAEQQALITLRGASPSFLLLTEPRQQGKTSFLNNLLAHPDLGHCCFLVVNAGPIGRNTSESDWYRLMSGETARQLPRYHLTSDLLTICTTQEEWREQLIGLGQAALNQQRLLVIMIDEFGHLPVSWRESFFASICAVRDSRAFIPPFNAITFVFAGSFRPEAMITDDNISPFNKARPLELSDFTREQYAELLERAGVHSDLATPILPRLFYWTDGQPYLSQRLAALILERNPATASVEGIDVAAQRLERTDKLLIPSIFSRLRANKRWLKQAQRILNDEEIEFAPSSLVWQAELATLGLIKEEKSTGRCVIRNPIYARALRRLLLEIAETSDTAEDREDTKQHLDRLIVEHTRRKEQIEIKIARFGFNVPAEVTLELEDIEKQVARLHEQLAVL